MLALFLPTKRNQSNKPKKMIYYKKYKGTIRPMRISKQSFYSLRRAKNKWREQVWINGGCISARCLIEQ